MAQTSLDFRTIKICVSLRVNHSTRSGDMLHILIWSGSLPYTGYCRDRSSINQTGINLPVSWNFMELAENSEPV